MHRFECNGKAMPEVILRIRGRTPGEKDNKATTVEVRDSSPNQTVSSQNKAYLQKELSPSFSSIPEITCTGRNDIRSYHFLPI